MTKKLLAALLAILMLISVLPVVSATFNDTEMDWDDHTTHEYDHCLDTACNVCGELRPIVGHVYDNPCDAVCNLCDAVREVEDHVSDSPACQDGVCLSCGVAMPATVTCVTNAQYPCQDGTCVTCGKVLYATADHTVDNGGDTVCNLCGGEVIPCDHTYDNDCDATCNKGCGYVRPVNPHEYTILNQKDENGHWHECACGAKTEEEPHTYIIQLKDEKQHWRVCDACSYEEAGSRVDHQFTITEQNEEYHWLRCECWQIDPNSRVEHEYDGGLGSRCDVCGNTCDIDNNCDPDCNVCGYERDPDPHAWIAADCRRPEHCHSCGITRGEKTDHVYEAKCSTECFICRQPRETAGHKWVNGRCSYCGDYSPTKVKITTQPKTTYAKEGATAKVTVKATGTGLKYTWYIKNASASKYSKSSVTASTYSVKLSSSSHNRRIYCVVTDKYGNKVQSNTVILRRQASITKESATVRSAQYGAKASAKVTAVGDGLKYTWYVKNNGASKYSKSSVTSSTYSATMSDKVKGRRVYCVVKDKYGKTVQSKTFTLRMTATITTQPKTVTVKKNATAKVTVKAKGDGLKYTWYIKNEGASKYSKSSVTKSTYSVKMTAKVKNRLVYVVVKDKYGNTVKSKTVRLKMK